ncbi:MAG TPA: PAS domain S-box protein, partial [Candidatus Binatia bacterium]
MNASIGFDWRSRSSSGQALALLLPLALSGFLFYLDLHAPDRIFFGLPYLLVVILAQTMAGGRAAAVAASSVATLVLAAPLLGHTGPAPDPIWVAALGRLIVVGTIGMMVVFLRQRDAARATLAEQAVVAENSVPQRNHNEMRLVNAQLHREIAERRRAELRSGYLASIVESSADAIIGQSLNGTIVSWNTGATNVYGHARADVIGRPSTCLLPSEQEAEVGELLERVARGERVDEVESVRVRSDGTLFDVSASFSPILDENGAIIGVSMIERDISRRMRAEEALQSLNAELEAKVHQRTEELEAAVGELETFSYSVSHDLRAPLRALHGFTDTLVEDVGERLEEDERDLLLRIQRAAGRMDRIIEDLLMLSRAGNHRIEKEVVNLAEVARSV